MATIDNLVIEVTASADAAAAALNRTASSANRLRGAAARAGGGMRDLAAGAKDAGTATQKAGQQAGNAERHTRNYGRAAHEAGKAAKKGTAGIATFWQALKRVAYYRFIRSIIKGITDSFIQGITNLYKYSSAIDGNFAKSMDSLATSARYFSNSIAAMVAPLVNALAPAFDFVIDKVVDLINWFNQFFSAISGADTYTVARRVASTWESTFEGAQEQADKLKKTILGFDEINKLQKDNSSGGSSPYTSGYQTYFKEMPLTGKFQGFSDAIQTAMQDQMDKISLIVGGAELALGALLVFSHANIGLGFELMAIGAEKIASTVLYNWNGISDDVKQAAVLVEAALAGGMAVGAILAFSSGNVGLGIGLMIGALSTGSSVFVNWNYMEDALRGPIGAVVALVSTATLALGIFALLGGNIPLGIGLILYGAAGLAATVAANWDNLFNLGKTAIQEVKKGWDTLANNAFQIVISLAKTVDGWIESFMNWIFGYNAITGKPNLDIKITVLEEVAEWIKPVLGWMFGATAMIQTPKIGIDVVVNESVDNWLKSLISWIFGISIISKSPVINVETRFIDNAANWLKYVINWIFGYTAITKAPSLDVNFQIIQNTANWLISVINWIFGPVAIMKKPELNVDAKITETADPWLETLFKWAFNIAVMTTTPVFKIIAQISENVEGWVKDLIKGVLGYGGPAAAANRLSKEVDLDFELNNLPDWAQNLLKEQLSKGSKGFMNIDIDLTGQVAFDKSLAKPGALQRLFNSIFSDTIGGNAGVNIVANLTGKGSNFEGKGRLQTLFNSFFGLVNPPKVNVTANLKKKFAGTNSKSLLEWITGNSKGIIETVLKIGGTAWTLIKSALHTFGVPGFAKGGAINNGSIQYFANGGFANAHGTMFIAGEAGPEIVGHIGGRTEVLNQSQLAATMYAAVRSAMSGVHIDANMYSVSSGEASGEGFMEYMQQDHEDMRQQNELLRQQNELLRQLNEKEFGISTTAINNAQRYMNRRSGVALAPVIT